MKRNKKNRVHRNFKLPDEVNERLIATSKKKPKRTQTKLVVEALDQFLPAKNH